MKEILKNEIAELENKLNNYEVEFDYNEYSLLNKKVKHKKYGEGTVTKQRNNIITVKFRAGEEKTFEIPKAFINGFLTTDDSNILQSQQKLYNEIIESKEKIIHELEGKMKELSIIENANNDNKYTGNEVTMMAVLTNVSFDDCIKNNIYCCKAEREFSKEIKYLALYNNKSINAIGKVKKIVKARYQEGKWNAYLYTGNENVTNNDIEQIEGLRTRGLDLFNCNIGDVEHYYFIIEKFVLTDYRKTSNYPLQHTKYFNLCEILDPEKIPEIEELGKILSKKEW